MRTRTAITAALLALAAGAAGCSSTSDDKAGTKPGPSATISKETQYLTAAHGITFNGTPSDEELLAYPPKWCNALDSGHSAQWMFDSTSSDSLYPIGMDWGTQKDNANELLVAGVRVYCPKHLDTVQAELRANGDY